VHLKSNFININFDTSLLKTENVMPCIVLAYVQLMSKVLTSF